MSDERKIVHQRDTYLDGCVGGPGAVVVAVERALPSGASVVSVAFTDCDGEGLFSCEFAQPIDAEALVLVLEDAHKAGYKAGERNGAASLREAFRKLLNVGGSYDGDRSIGRNPWQ